MAFVSAVFMVILVAVMAPPRLIQLVETRLVEILKLVGLADGSLQVRMTVLLVVMVMDWNEGGEMGAVERTYEKPPGGVWWPVGQEVNRMDR